MDGWILAGGAEDVDVEDFEWERVSLDGEVFALAEGVGFADLKLLGEPSWPSGETSHRISRRS